VISTVSTVLSPHPHAACRANDRILGALCVNASLIADGFQFNNAVLHDRGGEIGDAVLDRVVEPPEFAVDIGRPLVPLGDAPWQVSDNILPSRQPQPVTLA